MSIKLAKKTGFCFGVKRAIGMAESELRKRGPMCSLGSIIHNKQVVDRLAVKGLKVIGSVDEMTGKTLLISSHGLSPKVKKNILKKAIAVVDTTCPFVLTAQRIAGELGAEGYTVIIVGDANHPEVKALVDFVSGEVFVVRDAREAGSLKIKQNAKISVISQTTQSTSNFIKVVKAILGFGPKELRVFNTICKDAEERQEYAKDLAATVDLMLIVGGRHSANTRRLLEVCREVLNKSYLVETEDEIAKEWFKNVKDVGIASGASTPGWIIKKVADRARTICADSKN